MARRKRKKKEKGEWETMMYYVVKRVATQINAIGEMKSLHKQNKHPIVIMDNEAKDGLWFIIALPKEE